MTQKLKLLMVCHLAVPHHNAGGETTIHAAFRELVVRGHEVHIACRPHTNEIQFEDYEYEGVKVARPPHNRGPYQWFKSYAERFQPDLVLTHLDLTFVAEQLALDLALPLAHFVHNDITPGFHRANPLRCQLAIYNSEWIAERFGYKEVASVVVRPVVEPDRYRCERGTKVTLINPTVDKGADTFYALSKLLPHREFLVVKSVYGEQIAPPSIDGSKFPNVEVMEHTADVREAFRKSRVVLMPSIYESYGRVAVEAACAGIPAIVHPTEGLLEALHAEPEPWAVEFARHSLTEHRRRVRWMTPGQLKGGRASGGGIFCDRNDIDSWAGQIERLFTDEVYYRSRSYAALELAASLTPKEEFDRLENALLNTAALWQREKDAGKEAMWKCDRWIWKLKDGTYKAVTDQRIPLNAETLFAGIGTEIPERVAREHGWIGAKAIEQPAENKAFSGPDEMKREQKKKGQKAA